MHSWTISQWWIMHWIQCKCGFIPTNHADMRQHAVIFYMSGVPGEKHNAG